MSKGELPSGISGQESPWGLKPRPTVVAAGDEYTWHEQVSLVKEATHQMNHRLFVDVAIIGVSAAVALAVAASGKYETILCTFPLLVMDFGIFIAATGVRSYLVSNLRFANRISDSQEEIAYQRSLKDLGAKQVIDADKSEK